ncbi:amine oxidase, flavin-containing superfamily [Xylaria nigripes]|nr:amine oxidase, flavin-containing superfamily [Xylaria nigripes]
MPLSEHTWSRDAVASHYPPPSGVVCGCTDPSSYAIADIVERDVAIIGGGSRGSYTAVRLRDSDKSVVVVEKKDILGGHGETYINPFNGRSTHIGASVYYKLKIVQDYFRKFDVPLVDIPTFMTGLTYVDFTTGLEVDYHHPDFTAFSAALRTYMSHLEKEFVEKYGLQDLVPWIQINSLISGYRLTTERSDIQELYRKVRDFFGSDALLESKIIAMERPESTEGVESTSYPVRILVQTLAGRKLIVAKTIVCTIPPPLEGLAGFDLSQDEEMLLGKFSANGYYTGLLNNTGAMGLLVATGPGQEYSVPIFPGPYDVLNIDQGFTPDDEVKADILSIIVRLQEAQGIMTNGTGPDWLKFSSHSPFNLMVSNEDVCNGFYRDLQALQGTRNTFYHEAAWHAQDSTLLWQRSFSLLLFGF